MRRLKKERDDAIIQQQRLEEDLREARAELEACRDELEMEKEKHEKQMAFLLFEYHPPSDGSNPVAKQSLLGPVDQAMVENSTQVGDYVLGAFLGEGSFGSVVTGTHHKTIKQYAIKGLDKLRACSPRQMRQIEQELAVLSYVDHPNVIKLKEVLHTRSTIYIVMDLGSKDLWTYTRAVGITNSSLREIVTGILKPLAHLHANGICHMDLKPGNILIMKNVPLSELRCEHIKLCDFGLCTISQSSKKDAPVHQVGFKGTPGYFAPEIAFLRGSGESYDARPADMWSVACTILALTEGFPHGWIEASQRYKTDMGGFEQVIRNGVWAVHDPAYFSDADIYRVVCSILRMDPPHRFTASQALQLPWLNDAEDNGNSLG